MTAMVKLLCLYDEGCLVNTSLIGAKGTSFLLESDGKRLMFDTGLRDRYLLHNMEQLDIAPDSIDVLVVSQGFPDNCRALEGLLNEREGPLDVFAPEGLYDRKRGLLSGSVGLSDEARGKAVLHPLDGWTEVIPKVWVTPRLVAPDGYMESFLVVEGKLLTVISGRGHAGPGIALDAAYMRFRREPRMFVGSVQLEGYRRANRKQFSFQFADQFEEHGVESLYLNHCTGRDGMTDLRVRFGLNGVKDLYAGMSLDL